jgi:excisionase family DNA binding protein
MIQDVEPLRTARDLAKTLKGPASSGIGASTLYRLASEGKLPAYRVGRTGIRFRLSEVLDYIRIKPGSRDDRGR